MKKHLFILYMALCGFTGYTQEMRFEVKFSENYALLDFLLNLSQNDQKNPFITVFSKSEYNTDRYNQLLKEFSDINFFYTYEYLQYPYGNKIGGNTFFILTRNLIESANLEVFKRKSFGIIPNKDLNRLYTILKEFSQIYHELILVQCENKLNYQLRAIKELISKVNTDAVFRKTMHFHKSVWDTSLPFKLYLFPIPDVRERGFTATAFYNLAIAGIPQGYTNFEELLAVMFHESFHILYDEQPLEIKQDMAEWFTSNPSKNAIYAQLLFNEAITTSIANGYFFHQLTGKFPDGDWYNNRFISDMAQKLYPLVDSYFYQNKQIDQAFIDHYIGFFDNEFSHWITDKEFILMQRFVIAETVAIRNEVLRNHRYSNIDEIRNELTPLTIEEMKLHPITKVIVVTSEHKGKLDLVKENFDELINWTPNATTDFVYTKLLEDRTYLIIINSKSEDASKLIENLEMK